MHEAVDQRYHAGRVREHVRPFFKRLVGRYVGDNGKQLAQRSGNGRRMNLYNLFLEQNRKNKMKRQFMRAPRVSMINIFVGDEASGIVKVAM